MENTQHRWEYLGAALSGPLTAVLLTAFGTSLNLTSKTLIFLAIALIPLVRLRFWMALTISLENFLILNFFFTPPIHSFNIKNHDDLVTLLVFIILSVGLSSALNNRGIYSPTFAINSNAILINNWIVDFDKEVISDVSNGDNQVHLTPTEWKFLVLLFRAKGKIVSQEEILHSVWGSNYSKESHYLRLFMSQLRKKLEADPANPRYLITEQGRGYRLVIERPNT